MSKILMPGEKTTLPDGRTVEFMEVNIDAMDDVLTDANSRTRIAPFFMTTSVHAEAADPTENLEYL